MGLFKPAYMSNSVQKAVKAVRKSTDQKELVQAALKSYYARKEAVEQLTDRASLAEVARLSEDDEVIDLAIEKITDLQLLLHVKKYGLTERSRSNAHFKILNIESATIDEMTDKSALAQVAKTNSDAALRIKAALKCGDVDLIHELAMMDKEGICRYKILDYVTDQALLLKIAKSDEYYDVRLKAAARLNDKDLAQKVYIGMYKSVLKYPQPTINGGEVDAAMVLTKLTDQKTLSDIAKNEPDWYLRKDAIGKLDDINLLRRFVKEDRPVIYTSALDRLAKIGAFKKKFLEDIVINDNREDVGIYAIDALSKSFLPLDRWFLEDIVRRYRPPMKVRLYAFGALLKNFSMLDDDLDTLVFILVDSMKYSESPDITRDFYYRLIEVLEKNGKGLVEKAGLKVDSKEIHEEDQFGRYTLVNTKIYYKEVQVV